MKTAAIFGQDKLENVAAQAADNEAMGYDVMACPELGHDSMVVATMGALATQSIGVATGVTIAFPRSPMVLAMQAWDIQKISNGRFRIGLGSQVKGHNERRFSVPWSAPAPRLKEYVRAMHAIWDSFESGKNPDFQGEHYKFSLMTPQFNPGPLACGRPKIFVACVGEAMARMAGEVADGILPHGFMTEKYMRDVLLPNVAIGLARSGRTWSDIEISGGGNSAGAAAGGYAVFGETDTDIERGLAALRPSIANYASTKAYHGVLRVHGLEDMGLQLFDLSVKQKWVDMPRVLTDDALRTLVATATFDKIPDFLRQHREYASLLGISMPEGTSPGRFREVLQMVKDVDVPRAPRGLEKLPAV